MWEWYKNQIMLLANRLGSLFRVDSKVLLLVYAHWKFRWQVVR